MSLLVASLLTIGVVVYLLVVRAKDLPEPQPVSPFQHLDERKASIYDNLRDLQFEYRLGKLSDDDYQATKKDLQKELAGVMGEIDRVKASLGMKTTQATAQAATARAPKAPREAGKPTAPVTAAAQANGSVCPHCAARFEVVLKFCGECGKPMTGGKA